MINQSEFLPFHAINEFMRPDFRLSVIRDTLTSLDNLPEVYSQNINRLTRKLVKIPGFRNSEKAPQLMKVIPASKAFEKYPEFTSAILSAWMETNPDLKIQVLNLLKSRNWSYLEEDQPNDFDSVSNELQKTWPILPLDFDRTKLPGFYTKWPEGEDYETLYTQFINMYPEADYSVDKVSLMIVWISLRLPYVMEEHTLDVETTHDEKIRDK